MDEGHDRPRNKRRRIRTACTFCRRRKLKCDNNQPRCSNCQVYEYACSYAVDTEKPRPTNSRIRSLEEENRRLRTQLQRTASSSSDPHEPDGNTDFAAREVNSATTLRVTDDDRSHDLSETAYVNPSNQSHSTAEQTYHGTTSTLFDTPDEPTQSGVAGVQLHRRRSATSMQNGLIAGAVKQRQIENVNYNSGKLDFDGVDPDLGMHLLSLHWARQHHSFLITYRPAFMRDMACGGPYFSKLLLNAIYFGASKFSPRLEVRRDPQDVRTAGWQFRQRVKELLGESLDKSKVTTIQALLVMANSLFALGDERSAAWVYAGIAIRMIIDLGMHVDSEEPHRASRFSDEDIEVRRRVFWAAFVVDKIQSLYQGRPASLQDFDARVQLTFLDTYEEFEHWVPFAYADSARSYPGSPAYSVSTFTELCKLCVIMNKIINKIYSEKGKKQRPSELVHEQKLIHAELSKWRRALPDHLDFDPLISTTSSPPPHAISLLAMYEVMLVILHRPFVSEGYLHTKDDPTVALDSFSICATAATAVVNLIRVYDRDFSVKRAPYLIAYAIYVAATIHVRIAAQLDSSSASHSMLHFCLGVFAQNRETNWAVKRAEIVIANLMRSMGVKTPEQSEIETLTVAASNPEPHSRQNVYQSLIPPTNPIHDLDIDIDAVIQSFNWSAQGQPSSTIWANDNTASGANGNTTVENTLNPFALQFPDLAAVPVYDPLFGLYGSPSESPWFYGQHFDPAPIRS